MRTWGGTGKSRGVSVLVCTRGAAFEMDWWWFGFFSVDIVRPVKRDWAVLSKDTPMDISI